MILDTELPRTRRDDTAKPSAPLPNVRRLASQALKAGLLRIAYDQQAGRVEQRWLAVAEQFQLKRRDFLEQFSCPTLNNEIRFR
jgi:hypothetical protein